MRLWLRRNGIAAIAILILLPTTIAVTFSTEWGNYNESRAVEAQVVENGASATFGGAEWKVLNTARISAGSDEAIEAELPAGADLIVVTTLVSPGEPNAKGESPYCMVRLEELDGGTVVRSWNDSALDPIEYRTSDTAVSYCDTEQFEPYRLESIFVIPSEADGPFALKLEVSAELPRYLRLLA
ncbi:MAG TPA: hypothetical protein VGP24_03005 [Glaciihabitans sp.]|jgi:hypothetical protein|nr:hypothetical protein [Glaciihabitans sp.]